MVDPGEIVIAKKAAVGQHQELVKLAKTAKFQYNNSKVGPSLTIDKGKAKAKKEALAGILKQLEGQGAPSGKETNFNYIKASIQNMHDKGYAGVVHYDNDGHIFSAAAIDEVLKDSVHLDTIGGLGKGVGEGALYRVLEYSRDAAGRDGFVTLFSEIDALDWYEQHGFTTKPGAKNGRELMNMADHVARFMEWFEKNKM